MADQDTWFGTATPEELQWPGTARIREMDKRVPNFPSRGHP